MQLPEFALRIDLHDKRIRLRALNYAIVNTRDWVSRDRVGERWVTALQIIMLPVLFRIGVGVGETNVDEDPIRTGDPGNDAVEYLSLRLVFVKSQVDVVTQVSARLGATRGIGTRDVRVYGVGVAGVIAGLVAQERRDIPRRNKAKPHDDRILGLVNQLIHLGVVKPVEVTKVDGIGNQARLTCWTGPKRPMARRNDGLRTVFRIADGEGRMRHVRIGRFVGQEPSRTFEIGREAAGDAIRVLVPHRTNDWS